MTNLKSRILMTACVAFAGATGMTSSASAASSSAIYGGGSSLVAPYFRQAGDCYGAETPLIIAGTPPTFLSPPLFDYTGNKAQNCATMQIKPTLTINYISTGSGTGVAGLFSHDPTKYGEIDAQGDFYPSVQYGLSDAGLAQSDDQIWNNGGTEHGVTVVCDGCTPGQGQYPNPLQYYGPLVQFPFSVDPVTFAYNSTYEKILNGDGSITSYHFNLKFARADGSGGLRLDATTYCEIFNGQITNWNQIPKSLNGNQSLQDPNDHGTFSVPLQIVGRSDSSGTTSIFYRHLATVCASLAGNQYAAAGGTTLPATLIGATYNVSNPNYPPVNGETPGKFTIVANSSGVAQYLAFTAVPNGSNGNNGANAIVLGRIGYLGPDYALPYVLNTGANNYNLNTATLKNSKGQWEAPTPATALKAFGTVLPPQSNANGTYCESCQTNGLRSQPWAWAQPISNSSPLGNPSATGSYPVVGTTNFLSYTCFATSASLAAVNGYNVYLNTKPINDDPKAGILATSGLAPLPSNWRVAINGTFMNNTNSLGLNFGQAQTTPGACSVSGVVGG